MQLKKQIGPSEILEICENFSRFKKLFKSNYNKKKNDQSKQKLYMEIRLISCQMKYNFYRNVHTIFREKKKL